jgi:hypothetical protein
MSETEQWIEQTRKYLKTAHRVDGDSSADFLRTHITRIDVEQMRADLGCGEECIDCSWGSLGEYSLPRETCKVLVLQQAIENLHALTTRRAAASQKAVELLEVLDSLPSPRK